MRLEAPLFSQRLVLLVLLGLSTTNLCYGDSDDWQFSVFFPMIWVAEIDGTIGVADNSFEVNTSFEDTLDTLSLGYMTELYAQKGPWLSTRQWLSALYRCALYLQ